MTDETLRETVAPDGRRLLATLNQRYEPDGSGQETDLPGGWTVVETFAVEDGRRIVASVTIRPTVAGAVPTGGVTARLLRRVKVGQFAAGLLQTFTTYYGADQAARIFDGIGWASRPRRRKRPARLRADDRYYATLARDYVTVFRSGIKTPTAALAAARGVTAALMRSHIHLARKNGFLSETGRGKAGGRLTAKARGALARKPPAAGGRKKR